MIANDGDDAPSECISKEMPSKHHARQLQITDVDVHLGQTARAQLTAFVSMVTSKVFPALLHATWVDNGAYSKHTSREYFQGLPFPLSWTQPRFTRRAIVTMLRHIPEVRARTLPRGDAQPCIVVYPI